MYGWLSMLVNFSAEMTMATAVALLTQPSPPSAAARPA
jgi:hypothetical protein